MTNLTTRYLGLSLRNPLVVAASPLSRSVDMAKQLEDAGVAAIVMESLFEEQIEHEQSGLFGVERSAAAVPGLPDVYFGSELLSVEDYLEQIFRLKDAVRIPIIASLNGSTPGGWTRYANLLEQSGADAIELNIYFLATDLHETAVHVESRYLEIVSEVRGAVSVPLAVKLSPFFSAFANMASRLDAAGADGLVLFNRFYQPDIDLDAIRVVPHLTLSTPASARLPLRWIAILRDRVNASLAAAGGVHTAHDVAKMVLAGADVVHMATALLQRGPDHARQVLHDLSAWMDDHGLESIETMKGQLSHGKVRDPAPFERANYLRVLKSYHGTTPPT
jgi:dihydroorotate dehydrogenase (fumarate)